MKVYIFLSLSYSSGQPFPDLVGDKFQSTRTDYYLSAKPKSMTETSFFANVFYFKALQISLGADNQQCRDCSLKRSRVSPSFNITNNQIHTIKIRFKSAQISDLDRFQIWLHCALRLSSVRVRRVTERLAFTRASYPRLIYNTTPLLCTICCFFCTKKLFLHRYEY